MSAVSFPLSFNSRTTGSEPVNCGAIPCEGAIRSGRGIYAEGCKPFKAGETPALRSNCLVFRNQTGEAATRGCVIAPDRGIYLEGRLMG